MYKVIALCCVLLLAGSIAVAENGWSPKEEPKEKPATFCPKTLISDNNQCFYCHTKPNFKLIEALPDEGLKLPYGTAILDGTLHYTVRSIDSSGVQDFFDYVYRHPEYKHVVMEIFSPGGSLLGAWKIVGLMDQAKSRGITVETRCYGFAASAGFLIFVNGTIGHRMVNPMAEFMWHELWSFTFLKVETPSKKEDEAEVFRHLQDTGHNWLVTRCTKELTKEELDSWVRHKDKWMNGADMMEAGFADGSLAKGGERKVEFANGTPIAEPLSYE
jgi:ATP-dependent protease ClpP protease subunit